MSPGLDLMEVCLDLEEKAEQDGFAYVLKDLAQVLRRESERRREERHIRPS